MRITPPIASSSSERASVVLCLQSATSHTATQAATASATGMPSSAAKWMKRLCACESAAARGLFGVAIASSQAWAT